MAFDLQLAITGDEAAERRLIEMARRTRDPRPVLNRLSDMIRDAQVERFGQNRGMKKLAPSTLARKRREGLDERPLRRTGLLVRSVTVEHAREQIDRIHGDELTFGTSVYYARFHDKGEGVPKRRVINLTNRQRGPVGDTILDWVFGRGEFT